MLPYIRKNILLFEVVQASSTTFSNENAEEYMV
jgi:hypothetical protein